MDFFGEQRRARRNTFRLACLFLLGTAGVALSVYAAATAVLLLENLRAPVPLWDGRRFLWTALAVAVCIGGCAAYRTRQLSRNGGAFLAVRLGGKYINPATTVPAENILINVTEEMAVAAGIPPPMVYVLTHEPGLNAFAAGFSARDSIVCVTRGLLDALTREELQGVVGHEISHIANGDSRLNLRLAGALHGFHVFTVAGRCLTAVRGWVIVFGVLLRVIGSAGRFFGQAVQAGISREREYLADASSAQLTRNPAALAAALGKIRSRGSVILHPEAVAASHLFFGSVVLPGALLSGLLATHPPLAERIRRLGGDPAIWRKPPPRRARP